MKLSEYVVKVKPQVEILEKRLRFMTEFIKEYKGKRVCIYTEYARGVKIRIDYHDSTVVEIYVKYNVLNEIEKQVSKIIKKLAPEAIKDIEKWLKSLEV